VNQAFRREISEAVEDLFRLEQNPNATESTHLSQYGCKLKLGRIGRRRDDLNKGYGHVLKNSIGAFLEPKRFQKRNEVLVPDLLQHIELLVAIWLRETFHGNDFARTGLPNGNDSNIIEFKLVDFLKAFPRGFVLYFHVLVRADSGLHSLRKMEFQRYGPTVKPLMFRRGGSFSFERLSYVVLGGRALPERRFLPGLGFGTGIGTRPIDFLQSL